MKKKSMCLMLAAAMTASCMAPISSFAEESEEPIVLKMIGIAAGDEGDWNDYWIIQRIEELFNVDIQIEMITNESADEKLPLLFASDDLPDFFTKSLSAEQIAQYGSEGYLVDLSSYLSEETTPNLWALLEEQPTALAAMTEPDGSVYSLYGVDMAVHNQAVNRFYINYDWAEEILGKTPETLDEFYEYLKGVKEGDMNGNGDTTDEIPFGGCYSDTEFTNSMMPILQAVGFTRMEKEAIDGKVVYVPAEDNYKAAIEFMKKLYDEELLESDFFTQSAEQRSAKWEDGLYGAVGTAYIAGRNQQDDSIANEYNLLSPMTSEYNSERMQGVVGTNLRGNFIVTKECEHPEKVVEIWDWLLSEEGTRAVLSGPELGTWEEHPEWGTVFTEEGDELIMEQYYDDSYESRDQFARIYLGPESSNIPFYRNFIPRTYNNTTKAETPVSTKYDLVTDYQQHLEQYYTLRWPEAIKYTDDEANELALISTDLESYRSEMVAKMITGEVSLDDWDTYVQGLNDRGLERYLELQQAAYDRFMALVQ